MLASKENQLLKLFFNYETKQWHFSEIVKKADISEDRANHWLKQFVKQGIIRRVKPRGKMPYFIALSESPAYKSRKKLFALKQLYESGLLTRLHSLEKARTVIVFGSFARSDWHAESDIDLFIYGPVKNINVGGYERVLNRDIQVFLGTNKKELKKIGAGLLKNIIKGYLVKGDIPEELIKYACVQNPKPSI